MPLDGDYVMIDDDAYRVVGRRWDVSADRLTLTAHVFIAWSHYWKVGS